VKDYDHQNDNMVNDIDDNVRYSTKAIPPDLSIHVKSEAKSGHRNFNMGSYNHSSMDDVS